MKRELGQFFTKNAEKIFSLSPFLTWFKEHQLHQYKLIEPFAGEKDLIIALRNLGLIEEYDAYDIDPKHEDIKKQDTLLDFPKGDLVITNPPYLGKNKSKFSYDLKNFNNLYELALEKILAHSQYAAVIIPESFITSNFDKTFCETIISLPIPKLFGDTDQPVCLALFNKNKQRDKIALYKNNDFLGYLEDLLSIKKQLRKTEKYTIKFNEVNGDIDISCFDNHFDDKNIYATIMPFIDDNKIKHTSRHNTRIKIFKDNIQIIDKHELEELVKRFNENLKIYREKTKDVFMTSSKGMRKDGNFRRRLDFETIRDLFNA